MPIHITVLGEIQNNNILFIIVLDYDMCLKISASTPERSVTSDGI